MTKNTDRWMFYLPNDESGRAFIEQMKQVMNTDRYSIRCRGRRPDRKKAVDLGYCDHYRYRMFEYSVPVEVAKLLAVYVEDKVDDKNLARMWHENREQRKQIEQLEHDLQKANIEASYDDLQQEYRYNPANDTIKIDPECRGTNQVAMLEELQKLRDQVSNQRATIQHFQRIEESNNLLKAQVQTFDAEVKNLHDSVRAKTDYAQELLNQKMVLANQKMVLENRLNDRDGSKNILEDLTILISKAMDEIALTGDIDKFQKMLQENGKTITKQQGRIEELEELLKKSESTVSGLSCMLQNDMRDLDIPIED